ncbi:MAG TPA: response regulator [Rectinemataceae bacterium]|nr:response regulator [Rectinemataceae bacterium]
MEENPVGHNILLIDDDPFFQRVTKEFLEQSGFKVTVAASWMDFTKAYYSAAAPPDLILFDINLGGSISGDKLLAAFKKGRGTIASAKKTKLVLISARPESELAAKAREAGADGYIVKEALYVASGERLLAKLKAFLG